LDIVQNLKIQYIMNLMNFKTGKFQELENIKLHGSWINMHFEIATTKA